MGPIGSKVIEVKGQFFFLFVPPRSLGRSSQNLEGRWRAAPDISLRGSFAAHMLSSLIYPAKSCYHDARKSVFGFSNKSSANRPVQSKKQDRSLKFWI